MTNKTDPRQLQNYLEQKESYEGGLEPDVERLVDSLQEWQHETELQPRAGFVNELAQELYEQQRPASSAPGFWTGLWRRLIEGGLKAAVAVAAVALFAVWLLSLQRSPQTTGVTRTTADSTEAVGAAETASAEEQPSQRFTVNQTQMSGPVAITIGDVLLTSSETIVSIHHEAPQEVEWQPFGTPTLHYDGQAVDGQQVQPGQGNDDDQAWRFPVLPPATAAFTLALDPLWLTVDDDVEITLDVEQLQSGEQTVEVGNSTLSFSLAPAPEGAGFMLTYRPSDHASDHIILDDPGEPLLITDNFGNNYTVVRGNFKFEPDAGFVLEEHSFYTNEPLAEDATALTLHLEQTGRITEPVQFEIEVSQQGTPEATSPVLDPSTPTSQAATTEPTAATRPASCNAVPRPALLLGSDISLDRLNLTIVDPSSGARCTMRTDAYSAGAVGVAGNTLYYPLRDREAGTMTIWEHPFDGSPQPLPFTTTAALSAPWFGLTISDDGRYLVWATFSDQTGDASDSRYRSTVWLGDLEEGTATLLWQEDALDTLPPTIEPLHFSAEENAIYFARRPYGIGGVGPYAGQYSGLYTLSVDGREPQPLFTCQTEFDFCLNDVDFERRLLAAVTNENEQPELRIISFDGSMVASYSPPDANYISQPIFSPGGDVAFITADLERTQDGTPRFRPGNIRLLSAPYSDQPQTLFEETDAYFGLSHWFDNSHLVVSDWSDGQELLLLNLSGERIVIPELGTAHPLTVLQEPAPGGDEYRVNLSLADYPPRDTPYFIQDNNFWLVHTLEGELFVFVSISPEYRDTVTVEECAYHWTDAVDRFIDPCSGDEWELDGTLNLEHSAELWSNRDLDQYPVTVEGSTITVHLDQVVRGTVQRE